MNIISRHPNSNQTSNKCKVNNHNRGSHFFIFLWIKVFIFQSCLRMRIEGIVLKQICLNLFFFFLRIGTHTCGFVIVLKIIGSLLITNMKRKHKHKRKISIKISAAWLILKRNFTFVFMFPFMDQHAPMNSKSITWRQHAPWYSDPILDTKRERR